MEIREQRRKISSAHCHNYMLFKFLPFLTLLLLSSCGLHLVQVKHPLPKFEPNQKGFSSDLVGEYLVLDSINHDWIDIHNSIYHPKIVLPTDSSYMAIGHSHIIISSNLIVQKSTCTIYEKRSHFDARTREIPTNMDSVIFIGDTVKFVKKEAVDTLFYLDRGDILRAYKNDYFLNRWNDEYASYYPILITKSPENQLNIMILEENSLLRYY